MNMNLLRNLAIAAIASAPLSFAEAQEQTPVTANAADTLANSDGSVRFAAQNFGRTGQWDSNSSVTGVLILPFALPELPDGESVSTATLSINLEGWRNLERSLGDIDLYGLRVSAKPDVLASDFFSGEAAGDLPSGVILIQDGFVPASQIDNFKMEVNTSSTTTEQGAVALGAWVQSLYESGAKPGEFAFLALTIDNASQATDGSYYLFSTSEGEIAPTLTISIGDPATEPAGQADAAEGPAAEEADEQAPNPANDASDEPE